MKPDLHRPEKLGYVAFLLGVFLFCAGLVLKISADMYSLLPGVIASGVVGILALMGAGRARLAWRQADEEEAVEAYRAGHQGAELFADADEALKLAARANRSYVKAFLPFLTVLLGAGLLALAWLLFQEWTGLANVVNKPISARYAALALFLFAVGMLSGSYFTGVSREPGCRYLRPYGAWLFFAGALFGLSAAVVLVLSWDVAVARLDLRTAKVLVALLFALGAEMLLNVIVEFYRPRSPHEEERPLFESRILGIVTEPGGVARNVAAALDYQFGFRVSEAWFYRFLERTVIPFVCLFLVSFWLMSCFVVIKAEEKGLLIRCGRVVNRNAGPGLHVKSPWPFERMYVFPVERVQEVAVGFVAEGDTQNMPPDPSMDELKGDPTGRVMVWAKTHYKEEANFVVASTPDPAVEQEIGASAERSLPVTVNFLSASVTLYFKVVDLYAYAYRHRNPRQTIEEVTTRELVKYLTNVDFVRILAKERAKGGQDLRERIQEAATKLDLGIEVVFVGLQGLHPPVKVGKAFDEVVGAMEEAHAEGMKAERDAVARTANADGEAMGKVGVAKAYQGERVKVAAAEAMRFEKQLIAYLAAPTLYKLYTYLDTMENEGRNARKYVIALAPQSREVFVVNLEKKLRPDLLDLDIQKEQK